MSVSSSAAVQMVPSEMTPEVIAAHVAEAFGEDVTALTVVNRHVGRQRTARLTWMYLCAQYLPRPERYRTRRRRDGTYSSRRACDQDGNVKAVGRIAGTSAQAVRYALRRIEELRDNPEFDAMLTAIEEQLARSGDTR